VEQRFVRRTIECSATYQQGRQANDRSPNDPINGRDGMSDIIWALLNLTVGLFLQGIHNNLDLLQGKITEAQGKIGEGIDNADPTTEAQLRTLNATYNMISTQLIRPLQEDLNRVIPSLTSSADAAAKVGLMPYDASDIIEAIIGMTLAEFVEKIYCVMSTSDENMYNNIVSLEAAIGRVTDPTLKNILIWLVNKLTESRRGIQPHLTNLRNILGAAPNSQPSQ